MSRLPQRRSSAIQTDARPENGDAVFTGEPTASAPEARLGLGWRVCILLWTAGFLGLFAFEVAGLVSARRQGDGWTHSVRGRMPTSVRPARPGP